MISPWGFSMGGRNVSTFAKFTILLLLFLISFNLNAKWAWASLVQTRFTASTHRRMGKSKPDIFHDVSRIIPDTRSVDSPSLSHSVAALLRLRPRRNALSQRSPTARKGKRYKGRSQLPYPGRAPSAPTIVSTPPWEVFRKQIGYFYAELTLHRLGRE